MSKPRKSKLDQFAGTLADMERESKTLAEMVAWLKSEGCSVSTSTLSDYLSSLRSQRQQAAMLSQIASGARQCQEVEKQFAKNPAPSVATLIDLHRVMIMQLATKSVDNPKLLVLTNELTRTVMEFLSGQTKAAHKERELNLAESKFQFDATKLALKHAATLKVIATNPNLSESDKVNLARQKLFGVLPEATPK